MSYDSHSLSVKDMIHIFFQANCMVSYNWYRELYDFDSYASCIKDDTMNQASWNLSLYHNRATVVRGHRFQVFSEEGISPYKLAKVTWFWLLQHRLLAPQMKGPQWSYV